MDSIYLYVLVNRQRVRGTRQRLRELRDSSDPLYLPDSAFIKKFRLWKEAFKHVLKDFSKHEHHSRASSIPAILKLAAVLRFFSQGSYQENVAESYLIAISQSTFSTILKSALNFVENFLCPKWINFTMSENQKREAKRYFFEKTGFPGVIACVDGSHISIIRPHIDEHLFFGKEAHHTINAMIVCDHQMMIRAIDAKYGGATHDALTWSLSAYRHLETQHESNDRSYILGDSGYPLEPWIITPYRSAEEGSRNAHFNSIHSKARNIVERTIGLLKSRYRCIAYERQLHYKPLKVTKIINAACALHNIAIYFRVPFDEETRTEPNRPDETV